MEPTQTQKEKQTLEVNSEDGNLSAANVDQSESKASIQISQMHFSGPVPDPQTLKLYKQIHKQAPEIIFNMAQKEQRFRHFSTYFGQTSALLIGLGGLGVTAYLGVNNQPWLAAVIGFGSLGSLVGVFLHQSKKS